MPPRTSNRPPNAQGVKLKTFPPAPPDKPVVHYLHHGVSACEISTQCGIPGEWPEGHKWSSIWKEVNCSRCKATR